jgi:DNA topoisomerase-1
VVEITTVEIGARDYGFRATATETTFAGHWAVHPPTRGQEEKALPSLSEGQGVRCLGLVPEQHFTQPPARYNEASLIRALEQDGVGRPSTYAPTIQTLLQRRYVERRERALAPTALGRRTNDLLVRFFPEIIDVQFTAQMEEELDKVERGQEEWARVLERFYGTFEPLVKKAKAQARSEKPKPVPTGQKCPKCEEGELLIRQGPTGRFYGCSRYPRCKYTAPVPGEQPDGGPCPKCGKPLVQRRSRYGLFWGCSGYPECKYIAKEAAVKAKCPKAGCEGDLVRRRAKRRVFYGCSRYPACDFATSLRPIGKDCPECGAALGRTARGGERAKCLNPECDFEGDPGTVEPEQGESG